MALIITLKDAETESIEFSIERFNTETLSFCILGDSDESIVLTNSDAQKAAEAILEFLDPKILKAMTQSNLYDRDFNLWTEQTAQQLKDRDFNAVDWENLIEEIEGLNRSDKREIAHRLTVLLEHILKLNHWEAEREYNARGWRGTIAEQQIKIQKLLKESPSLKPFAADVLAESYADAKEITSKKTGMPVETFPEVCPYSLEQILSSEF